MAASVSYLPVIIMTLFAAPAVGEQAVRTVSVYDGHASLEIPEAWNEIPPEVLEFYSLRSAETSGGAVAEIYQHGFRLGDPEADFDPPQILIQIRESGRISYGELLHMPPLQSMRSAADEQAEKHPGPFLEDLALGTVVFDRETFSLRVTTTLDLTFEGRVIVHSGSFLTERGTFTVHCYAVRPQYRRMEPVFERVLASVRLDDALRYKPRLTDRLPPRPAMVAYAIAAILAAGILVVHLMHRRRLKT